MDTTTLDFNSLILLVAIMSSTLTIVTLMFRQSNRHDDGIKAPDTKVTTLETRFDGLETRFDGLDAKFNVMGRDVSDVRERLARIEGHLMAPEGFRVRGLHPPAPEEPSPEDPGRDHRQAG